MIDNEIIKALECCGNIVDSTCKGCVYHETYNASCVVRLMRDALDLINRTKLESKKYRGKCTSQKRELTRLYEETNRQKAEIERLENELKITREYIHENNLEFDLLSKIEHNSLCETETYESR